MATTTAPVPPTLADLSGLYGVRDGEDDEIAGFIETYPFVVPLLIEARPVIARYFGAETPVVLELDGEPDQEEDDDEDLRVLFGTVRTTLPPEEARPRLNRFGQEWWYPRVREADGRLSFNVWYY